MQVVFYNAHQNGDLIFSRQGVRWIVDKLGPNHDYYYIHNKNSESLFFHENIKVVSMPFQFHGLLMPQMQQYFKQNNQLPGALWIDAWIGEMKPSRYVIDHNDNDRWVQLMPNEKGQYILGECVEVCDNIHWQEMLWKQNVDIVNERLSGELTTKRIPYPTYQDLVPKWSGYAKQKDKVDDLLAKNSHFKLSLLICNSDTQSRQRQNFSYENILKPLIEKYPDVAFYFTDNNEKLSNSNVFYINDIFGFPNLNEVEYLTKSIDISILSMSGPGCMPLNDLVFNDPNKTLIYFHRTAIGLYYPYGQCKYVQSEDWSDENILEIVQNNIEEKL
jgi:hypothetical protein